MTIRELLDEIRVLSGNYMVPTEIFDLDIDQFRILTIATLKYYSTYRPRIVTETRTINSTTYTYSSSNKPDFVSDVIPVRYFYRTPMSVASSDPILRNPMYFNWRYDKPSGILFVDYGGIFSITEAYSHYVQLRVNNDNEPVNLDGDVTEKTSEYVYDIIDVDTGSDTFLHLILGRVLMAIGSGRGAVRLDALQTNFSADDMYQRGQEIYQNAKESLAQKSDWYLAWT